MIMKNIITLLLLSTSVFSFGQSIPNSGFESWTNGGTYETPDNWINLNALSMLGFPVCVSKSSPGNSGSYAVKLETKKAITGDTVPGVIISGSGDLLSGNTRFIPFDKRPTKLMFYYSGGPVFGDTGAVVITLTRWDAVSKSQEVVGATGFIVTGIQSGYKMVESPMIYMDATQPDTVMIMATSSGSVPIPGSTLILDDISLEYSPVGIYENKLISSTIFPNPVKTEFSIQMEQTELTSVMLFDNSGRIAANYNRTNLDQPFNVEHLKSGAYIYQVKNGDKVIATGKLNIIE